jgi:hypothetical protein
MALDQFQDAGLISPELSVGSLEASKFLRVVVFKSEPCQHIVSPGGVLYLPLLSGPDTTGQRRDGLFPVIALAVIEPAVKDYSHDGTVPG